jgi:hypothetical protein
MGQVLQFTGRTLLDLPPDQVIEKAIGKLSMVVVIGLEVDSGDFYAAAGGPNIPEALWLAELLKKMLLSIE